ncbi:MAG: T9SS type A sorting domain-containing protein [candidate division WOR-3 bacterium]|nr:T9SS type A sorting domain-containing protein [candidate division WOR-3 bacterium]
MKSIFILCGTALCLIGSTAVMTNASREFQIVRHNGNNVELCVSNYGKFGQDETGNNAGCWWPIGSGHNYIYGAGIWFGTVDMLTGDTLVTIGYGPHGGESEFAPGLAGWPVSHPAAIIYIYPENWPAPPDTLPMAPQGTVSHEDSWCCFNDCDSVYHIAGDTRPIGIEVYQTVYVWDFPYLEDMIFFTYDVKNVSGHLLNDCYIGICADCDIGNEAGTSANDRYCGIVYQEYVIDDDTIIVDDVAYQWQEVEEPGVPPWNPGVIGFDLLQTPLDLVAGMDKDGDGILDEYERDSAYYVINLPASMWDADNDGVPDWRDPSQWPQVGISALKRFTLAVEPNLDAERYATLAGYNFVTGLYEPFDTVPPDPDDQRFLLASGPFDLEPDSIVTLVFALIFADWIGIYMRPDTALALIDQWAEDYYNMYWYLYTGIEEDCELRIANCEMRILPNPISNTGLISFSLPAATGVSLKLYNTLGQLVETVYDGFKPAGVHEFVVNTHGLPQGTYFLVLEAGDFKISRSIVVLR